MATQPSHPAPVIPFVNTQGMPYMPIQLKGVLSAHRIRQADWAAALTQAGGRGRGSGISEAAASLLLNYNSFPRATPRAQVVAQTEAFLRSQGVSATEIAHIWDQDANDAHRHGLAGQPPRRAAAPAPDPLDSLPETVMLTANAKKHFKLFQNPFENDIQAPEDVFLAAGQRYIRETMFSTAKHGGFLAVIGESGAGKTVLRRDLIDRIQREGHPITIIQPRIFDKSRLTAGSICEAIIKDISQEVSCGGSLETKARRIEQMLTSSSRAGYSHVLMIEEAHDLHVRTLKYLKRFWEMEDGFRKLLAIILIGQPELKDKLDERQNFEAREVIRRCEVAELEPLNGDMEEYIRLKLKRVGKELADLFDPPAFDAIRARLTLRSAGGQRTVSMHYPLVVNNTVVKCLNLAAEIGAPKVSADIVQGV